MESIVGYLGFLIAAYAIIANDIIQTLGTFLASNYKRPWCLLWGFAGVILLVTLVFGWLQFQGGLCRMVGSIHGQRRLPTICGEFFSL